MNKTNNTPDEKPVSASALVKEFHETYNLPIRTTPDVDVPEVGLRLDLIMEEVIELIHALYGERASNVIDVAWKVARDADDGNRDIVEVADALADIEYVVHGAALVFGIDLDAVLQEVQASNMSKLDENGKPIYREDGKVLKGPNFFEPKIEEELKNQGWEPTE